MGYIVNVIGALGISLMLSTAYPQQLLINSELQSSSEFRIVEKSIRKDLDYLKEDIKIPQLIGGNDEKKINLINSIINKNILPKANEAEEISKQYFDINVQEKPRFPYEVYSTYNITSDKNSFVSFYDDYYEYLGGAHGLTSRTSYTIDKNKEELLNLKDLFASGYNYADIINNEIREQIKKNPQDYFDSGSEFKGIGENQSFYIDDDNLVIYYQLYEIAPYVKGIPEFKIPLSTFGKNFIY
ncbi:DUF3298 and DUF4163 domain-containing protein [Clostridium saccharobutylicum]|uniref:Anti-sigma-V factor RsiV n=1 Tax=Clostridium saccharobutylicum DSM 13864 TaxID=1345695 RepID=U5MPQ3_CLOSA|nr:DUF3298 and DUF4163 domain-containing protein [Clostridium saccharobutylicum]AGX41382.1 hypothetical protein CLSA_c03320 [Clostridium saccharobutylicum DSM 13864]AQR88663.1 anti-sigma-V factor RsiV [Clostridium saccharobutylicum]AQR98561.1 anti-sigma-V factor RsiV [Clostridium saccharobutylicum]AQS12551.1 anti-sigma-V factor RsiV [Clostridium saccharobutylicum]MBA2905570.1 hypothetical protein [Clostridium saccharobutylicum]